MIKSFSTFLQEAHTGADGFQFESDSNMVASVKQDDNSRVEITAAGIKAFDYDHKPLKLSDNEVLKYVRAYFSHLKTATKSGGIQKVPVFVYKTVSKQYDEKTCELLGKALEDPKRNKSKYWIDCEALLQLVGAPAGMSVDDAVKKNLLGEFGTIHFYNPKLKDSPIYTLTNPDESWVKEFI